MHSAITLSLDVLLTVNGRRH